MRLVKIENLEYTAYEFIADKIYEKTPFALVSAQYRPKLRTGFFFFWDSDYIPDSLKIFIQPVPPNEKLKQDIDKNLLPLFEEMDMSRNLRTKPARDTP